VKKNLITTFTLLILMSISFNLFAENRSAEWQWVKGFFTGGRNSKGVVRDSLGNIYFSGSFTDTLTIGQYSLISAGSSDFYIAKFDSAGNCLWLKGGGGTKFDFVETLAMDRSGNLLLGGSFSGSMTFDSLTLSNYNLDLLTAFVIKFDNNGNVIWGQSASGGMSTVSAVTTDQENNCYIGGYFTCCNSPTVFGDVEFTDPNCIFELFVVKYDVNGNFCWGKQSSYKPRSDKFNPVHNLPEILPAVPNLQSKESGRYGPERFLTGLAVDSQNNIYFTGNSHCNISFGSFDLNITHGEVFITKMNNEGEFVWSKASSGAGPNSYNALHQVSSIKIDQENNILIAGTFGWRNGDPSFCDSIAFGEDILLVDNGQQDIFLLKMDAAGNYIWAKNFGGTKNESVSDLHLDNSGNIYMSGSFAGSFTFGSSQISTPESSMKILIGKCDQDGNPQWAEGVGDISGEYDLSSSIRVDNDDILLGGRISQSCFFGDIEYLTNRPNTFIAKRSNTTSIFSSDEPDKILDLVGNYPNPFNNSTMVSYQLNTPDLVQLSVYNVKGELVKNLVNANQSSGKHSVTFKADGLNSGVYYIKMQSGRFSSVQKCLMVK